MSGTARSGAQHSAIRVVAEHVVEGVSPGRVAAEPSGGAERAACKEHPIGGVMRQFQNFSGSGEAQGMLADGIAGANGVDAIKGECGGGLLP